MTNVTRHYVGYVAEGQYLQRLAAELGLTPLELIESDWNLFDMMLDYDFPAPGQVTVNFRAGLSMSVQYDPATLTITSADVYYQGQPIYNWRGQMTVEQLVTDDWPETVIYGSDSADYLEIENGTIYAGGGNDIIQIFGNSVVYGGAGREDYAIEYAGHGDNIRIADYQLGERIYFSAYDDFTTLAQSLRGVSATANGFSAQFAAPWPGGSVWTLTIEGVSLDQFAQQGDINQILLTGVAGEEAIYAPLWQAIGLL